MFNPISYRHPSRANAVWSVWVGVRLGVDFGFDDLHGVGRFGPWVTEGGWDEGLRGMLPWISLKRGRLPWMDFRGPSVHRWRIMLSDVWYYCIMYIPYMCSSCDTEVQLIGYVEQVVENVFYNLWELCKDVFTLCLSMFSTVWFVIFYVLSTLYRQCTWWPAPKLVSVPSKWSIFSSCQRCCTCGARTSCTAARAVVATGADG